MYSDKLELRWLKLIMSSSFSKIRPHMLVFKFKLTSPDNLFRIRCKSLKTNRQKWTWESNYFEICFLFDSISNVVCVLLLMVEAVFGRDAFFTSSIGPETCAICPFKKVNLLIFFGVLILFLFKEVSCLFGKSS